MAASGAARPMQRPSFSPWASWRAHRLGGVDLDEVAASVGSDVPVCLRSGLVWMRGRGEVVVPAGPAPDLGLLVVTPSFGCSTPAVYRAWDGLGGPVGEAQPAPGALADAPGGAAQRPRAGGPRRRAPPGRAAVRPGAPDGTAAPPRRLGLVLRGAPGRGDRTRRRRARAAGPSGDRCPRLDVARRGLTASVWGPGLRRRYDPAPVGSLIKKRRKRMRKKKHKKLLKRTRWQRRAGK